MKSIPAYGLMMGVLGKALEKREENGMGE